MPTKPTAAKVLTAEQRDQLETVRTLRRIVELDLESVRGNFDAAHLKEASPQKTEKIVR